MNKESNKFIGIPAMTPTCVHSYLYEIGTQWSGKGVAVEFGSWLGATAVPLVTGLTKAGYDKPFYCYDRWTANNEEVQKAKMQGINIEVGQNLFPIFLDNVSRHCKDINAFRGPITSTLKWGDKPIEICIFDAPKRNPTFSFVMEQVAPNFIPGVTILGLLDFYFYLRCDGRKRQECKIPVRFITENGDCFIPIAQWPDQCSCVFFKYTGGTIKIPR